MISAGNIFNDLATALRRTMSPIRKRDANAAATAAAAAGAAVGEGPSDKPGGSNRSPTQTMEASGDVEGAKENVELERKSPSSPAASAADHKARKTTKKRARFEPLPAAASEAPSTAADSDRRTKSLRQRRRQSLAVGMEGCGGRDLARTNSGGHGGAPSPSSSSSHKRSRAAAAGQYKRRQSMAATVAAQAAALSGTSPHFHPDLTLEKLREMQTSAQQKKQASLEASLTPMQSLDFNDAQFLEINTMFDFHPVPGTSPPPKSAMAAAVAAETTTSKERPSRPRLRSGDEKQLEDKADQSAKVSWVPN